MPVLFLAEVDHIQSVLFRASRQRQVTGGSRLLYHLGKEVIRQAKSNYALSDADIFRCGGGSFLMRFPDKQKAEQFGQDLASACRLLLDASITIAEPLEYVDNAAAFEIANETIHARLSRSKREKNSAFSTRHAPTTAFCQASGVGLASIEGKDGNGGRQYLSRFANLMEKAGSQLRDDKDFLAKITEAIDPFYAGWDWPEDADQVAAVDEIRGNVAYLVADGNSMGEWFRLCAPDQVLEFASALDKSVQTAIGTAANRLIGCLMDWEENSLACLPFLPLITAGDDVFVLLSAPYAIGFARLFCRTFEHEMGNTAVVKALREQYKENHKKDTGGDPSISAAVVFCKGNFPYHIAHERGETLLKQAKAMGKKIAKVEGGFSAPAALTFDFIAGGALVEDKDTKIVGEKFKPTAAPYWISPSESLTLAQQQAGLSIDALLKCRLDLALLPRKRLEELEAIYAQAKLPSRYDALKNSVTVQEMARLRQRLTAKKPKPANGVALPELQILEQCLVTLGDEKTGNDAAPGHWRHMIRDDEAFYGHALPDMLKIWLYAQDFDHKLAEYLECEEA